mmetsp:Transcript_10921/g.36205  ORF Transcript_10921/g.36205 Transcript_10921/m.36205 type:complete len:225 (+) Transcript_10921:598-1272(+)
MPTACRCASSSLACASLATFICASRPARRSASFSATRSAAATRSACAACSCCMSTVERSARRRSCISRVAASSFISIILSSLALCSCDSSNALAIESSSSTRASFSTRNLSRSSLACSAAISAPPNRTRASWHLASAVATASPAGGCARDSHRSRSASAFCRSTSFSLRAVSRSASRSNSRLRSRCTSFLTRSASVRHRASTRSDSASRSSTLRWSIVSSDSFC